MVAGLLTACAAPSTPPESVVSPVVVRNSVRLRALTRQLTVLPGAPAQSTVAAVNYDLLVPGAGGVWLPDDGVPGDEVSRPPRDVLGQGGASWYGIPFHQRKTANGERFNMMAMTAAHRTLPFGTRVCVKSLVNGREVMVRINDRGPYVGSRIIDLSRAAADSIGMLNLGIKQVSLSRVNQGERCGDAINDGGDSLALTAATASAPVKRVVHSHTRARVRQGVALAAHAPAVKRKLASRSN